jgi:hypothetical protein
MATDGIIVVIIGFLYLLRVKYSFLRRGIWKPSDPTNASEVESRDYTAGFVIIAIGVLLVLVGNSALVSPFP